MSAICYHCEKGSMYGHSHTHRKGVAGGRWKKRAPKTQKIFKVNLQKMSILESGKPLSVRLCAKCIKRAKKDVADGNKPMIRLITYKETVATEENKPEIVN